MKFGQLIEYNIRNIFLEKPYAKCNGKTIPRPFSKKSKLTIYLNLFSLTGKLRTVDIHIIYYILYWNYKLQTTWFCHIFFLKKRGLELVSLLHFLLEFWRKVFLLLYSITGPNFIAWLPLFREILGIMCIVIACCLGCDVINFEIKLLFLIEQYFLHGQKTKTII